MTQLQQALRDGSMTPADIQHKLGIICKTHKAYPNLWMFKYDMINSPMGNPIVQECRGIILDADKNWDIVAYPFDKFFNEGEGHAKPIDWSTARVQEKLDGSLMIMYHYAGQWQIASSGTPDAGGQVHALTKTFAELFWDTFHANAYSYPDGYEKFTFMFELMTPYNRVVVPHREAKIALIGARNNETLAELPVSMFYGLDYPVVKEFDISSLEAVVNSFANFDGIDQEGYVVVDAQFNRVKIKHPGYVAIHHLKGNDGPSHKKMFEIVVAGESSEVLTYFPEWKPIYDEVTEKFEALLKDLQSQYIFALMGTAAAFPNNVQTTPAKVQKEFASRAVKSRCPDALFKMYSKKVTNLRDYFKGISVDHSMKIMGYKD